MEPKQDVVLRAGRAVTAVGGAPFASHDLVEALAVAPRLVAADSGADAALALGHEPELVVGDLDSIGQEARARLGTRVREITDQDTTDFEKVLNAVEAPLVVGVGFLGARLDHALAALSALVRTPQRCLLIGPHEVAFAAPQTIHLELEPGTRVSLFPMGTVTGRSRGLRWPIDGIAFAPGGRIGTSNEALGPVRLWLDEPGMIVLLPRRCASAALAGLR